MGWRSIFDIPTQLHCLSGWHRWAFNNVILSPLFVWLSMLPQALPWSSFSNRGLVVLWKVSENDPYIFEVKSGRECAKSRKDKNATFNNIPTRWKRWSGAFHPLLHLHIWDAWGQGGLAQADVPSHTGRRDYHKVGIRKYKWANHKVGNAVPREANAKKMLQPFITQGCHMGDIMACLMYLYLSIPRVAIWATCCIFHLIPRVSIWAACCIFVFIFQIPRVAIWAACCIFPQFLVATISLSRAFRRSQPI